MSCLRFKALGDDTRLRLLRILLQYELSVNELVHILGMGQSRVSRHLKILSEAGLLNSRREGLWVFYRAPESGEMRAFLNAMMAFAPEDATGHADMQMAERVLEERASRTRNFFNAIAEDWDELNREILGDFDLAAEVAEALPAPCGIAVDLGCGTGLVLEKLMKNTGSAIGVDGSQRMLDLCRRRFGREAAVSLRIGELSHLPLADREADFACMNLVLHHVPDPMEVLFEGRRILKEGGILFLADFCHHHDEGMRVRFGDHWLGFEPAKLRAQLEKAGFAVENEQRRQVGRGLSLFLVRAVAG